MDSNSIRRLTGSENGGKSGQDHPITYNYNRKNSVNNQTYKKRKKRRKKKNTAGVGRIFVIAAIMLAVVAGAAAFAIWYFSFENICLAEETSLVLSGYDGYGKAELNVSGDTTLGDFFQTVEGTLDKCDGLSNGDQVTISYTYDEEAARRNKIRVDDTAAVITVADLPEPQLITHDELFEGLKATFDGIAPCITLTLENTATQEPYSMIEYVVEGGTGYYDNGESITVRADIPDEVASDHAYDIELSDSDYCTTLTAPTGDRYLTDASQITTDMLDELEQYGFKLISESDAREYGLRIFQGEAHVKPVFEGNKTTFKWLNPRFISAYFHSVTDEGKGLLEAHANDVQIIYEVSITQADGKTLSTEMVIQFINLLEKEDGTIDLNEESGRIVSVSYKDSNIKSLINDDDEIYNTTKLATAE